MAESKLFSYESFVRATSGAAGSIFAMSVFYPLDTIRFRLQVEDESLESVKNRNTFEILWHIIKEEGFTSLYKGMKPVLQSLAVSNFVYFYAFHGLRKKTNQGDLVLGMIAGITNVIFTLPLWVVNSRLKLSNSKPVHYKGLLDGLMHIAMTEGVGTLWNGLGPSLMLVMNPAIQMAVYESLKRQWSSKTAAAFFIMGAIAKTVSTIITYPIQLAQAKQRQGIKSNMSSAALILSILKRNGVMALFQGLEAKLLQTVLTTALMFSTYEKIVRFIFKLFMSLRLG